MSCNDELMDVIVNMCNQRIGILNMPPITDTNN